MEKRLSNKLTMYRYVQNVLLKYKSAWQVLVMFVTAANELDEAITDIGEASTRAGQTTNGTTENKNKVQETLLKITYRIASALTAYASRNLNFELKAKIDYSEAELFNLRQNQMLEAANEVIALAQLFQTDLEPYGISADDLSEMGKITEQFRNNIPGARNIVSSRQTAGKSMRQIFNQTDQLLEDQLDRIIEKFRSSNSDFYEEYHNARKIVNYGIRHEKPEEGDTDENKE